MKLINTQLLKFRAELKNTFFDFLGVPLAASKIRTKISYKSKKKSNSAKFVF